MTSHDAQARRIRETAAEWAVRLSGTTLTAGQQRDLQAWLECDPRHAEALAFARQTWDALGALPGKAMPAMRQRPNTSRPLRRAPRKRIWAAAACLFLLLGGLGLQRESLWVQWQADHYTHGGEVRHLTLADGSEVSLDSDSAIRLDFNETQRRIELLAGTAVFQVAADPHRPFVVSAAGGASRALGTRFVVSRESRDSAWSGVLEHAVQVDAAGRHQRLEAGDSVHYDSAALTPLHLDLQRATSWQRGLLIFERVPLAQAIEQINRYRPGYILIHGQALAEREVSGVFRLDSLDSALETLTRELHLKRLDLARISLLR
ncbi:FecR domain-containing protein [Pseudomonas sp. ABC1]|uniref:FecR family protein n=1 Tax=Pseudomonas sp. ABC1 TaxID=2748080 RepID=UPI0015C3F68B|nr:FecR domain-containing protein [Pseudomonas sp. ABC1]QLF93811.1 FecR domain-containing protein [Pseudomonas sp. ABC1]